VPLFSLKPSDAYNHRIKRFDHFRVNFNSPLINYILIGEFTLAGSLFDELIDTHSVDQCKLPVQQLPGVVVLLIEPGSHHTAAA